MDKLSVPNVNDKERFRVEKNLTPEQTYQTISNEHFQDTEEAYGSEKNYPLVLAYQSLSSDHHRKEPKLLTNIRIQDDNENQGSFSISTQVKMQGNLEEPSGSTETEELDRANGLRKYAGNAGVKPTIENIQLTVNPGDGTDSRIINIQFSGDGGNPVTGTTVHVSGDEVTGTTVHISHKDARHQPSSGFSVIPVAGNTIQLTGIPGRHTAPSTAARVPVVLERNQTVILGRRQSISNPVAIQSLLNTAARQSLPNTAARQSLPNTDAIQSLLNSDAIQSLPYTITRQNLPNTAAIQSLPNSVATQSLLNTDAIHSLPYTVASQSLDNTVANQSFSNTLPRQSLPNSNTVARLENPNGFAGVGYRGNIATTAVAGNQTIVYDNETARPRFQGNRHAAGTGGTARKARSFGFFEAGIVPGTSLVEGYDRFSSSAVSNRTFNRRRSYGYSSSILVSIQFSSGYLYF